MTEDLSELQAYMDGIAESVPKNAPESDFADPPKGLYVGDAKHARLAVQAVTTGFRGNTAKSKSKAGVKAKIASAIRKFYSGKMQDYYLSWLHTGKKPDAKPVQEMISFNVPDIAVSGEPDVPFAPGLELSDFMQNDPAPLFVIRPIGVLGGVSRNGLEYDESLLSEIERQVIQKRPPARRGHVAEADKDWRVPDSVGFWVGAQRVGNVLYGKAYILPNQPFHAEMKVGNAIGSEISNSIYGDAALMVDESGTMRCVGLKLESIDFVPPERAALPELGGDIHVTSEMEKDDMANDNDQDDVKEMKSKVASLKPSDLHEMMSPEQRQHCAETYMKEMDSTKVYEMLQETQRSHVMESRMKETSPEETYGKLSEAQRKCVAETYAKEMSLKMVPGAAVTVQETKLSEMTATQTTMQAQIAEMQTELGLYRRQEFDRELDATVANFFADWQVKTDDGKTKLAAIKQNLRVLTVAEMAGSTKKEDIKPAADKAWENVKPLAEVTRASLSGPSAFVGVHSAPGGGPNQHGFDPNTGRYSDEAVAQARARANILPQGGN